MCCRRMKRSSFLLKDKNNDSNAGIDNEENVIEIRLESLDRIPHKATYTKVDLVIRFVPGNHRKGAVVMEFLNAIHVHDECVHQVEEKWVKVDGKYLCAIFDCYVDTLVM